jgi:hypothetical protein
MSWAKNYLQAGISNWNLFWFDSRNDSDLKALSLFRLIFCSVMLFCYFSRSFDIEFFYGFDGILPYWHHQNVEFFRYHDSIIRDWWKVSWIFSLHCLFLFLLFSQAIGLFTRFSAIATYFLHMMFLNRNMGVMFGVDMIATFFLLYLCFANTNAYYSVDAWRKRGAKQQSWHSHIALRLMQIQLCVVYGYSGLEKMKGTRWWDGSAVWDVLSIGNMQRWDLSFVAHFPILLAANVYIVLLWEIYFPALIWQKRFRLPVLAFGFLMHIGIYLFMNLPSFAFMMISLYALFLKKEEIETGLRFLQSFGRRKAEA